MPQDAAARVATALADRGYNADPEAVTLIASAADPDAVLTAAIDAAPGDIAKIRPEHVRTVQNERSTAAADGTATQPAGSDPIEIVGDVTGRSTGTGTYDDFVDTFQDRYRRLSAMLRPHVSHRPASSLVDESGGTDTAVIGLVNDVRPTASGHTLVELEDTTGTVPCLFHDDQPVAAAVDDLLLDEVVAVEGTLADDGPLLFANECHWPDVPRTFDPTTADRTVSAALVSDLHVGSQEFRADAWERFTDWLETDAAESIEHLLIAGDMVEGVGVYPGQDEELEIVDVYDQYDRFADRLATVPDRISTVMIPGNHDAVRLAEPQPGFDESLRDRLSDRLSDDVRIVGNPSTVVIEGVSILLYHGVSLDEVVAAIPGETYDTPDSAMEHLLRKRHLAPQYGGGTQFAPEDRDYLVIDDVPDVFHAGHVHKTGWRTYRGVRVLNTGCWQSQTSFQRTVNIDPDVGYAAILDLESLDLTIREFG